jgi:hypothetical protein
MDRHGWDTTAFSFGMRSRGIHVEKPLKHDAEVFWIVFDRAGQRVATASRTKQFGFGRRRTDRC